MNVCGLAAMNGYWGDPHHWSSLVSGWKLHHVCGVGFVDISSGCAFLCIVLGMTLVLFAARGLCAWSNAILILMHYITSVVLHMLRHLY